MHLFTITSHEGVSIRVERMPISNKITFDRIGLIKLLRSVMQCGLRDSKEFVDNMLTELNNLQTTPEGVRSQITGDLYNITDVDVLLDVLGFMRDRMETKPAIGRFTDDGEYIPLNQRAQF